MSDRRHKLAQSTRRSAKPTGSRPAIHASPPSDRNLAWIDWHAGAWWSCYANYDNKGGDPTRDHTATTLVKYDAHFVEQGSWLFPEDVLTKFGHVSASSG
ncbi:hypothetical protein [Terriglobus roseus]|uniref:hypothetical protein n=1 Tax=Terriglobus roseus TaxID=392734 RepID=UPI0009455AE0|nr:hypothetical protein [Terriglobus roseus]